MVMEVRTPAALADIVAGEPREDRLNDLEPAHIEVEEETETYARLVAEPLNA